MGPLTLFFLLASVFSVIVPVGIVSGDVVESSGIHSMDHTPVAILEARNEYLVVIKIEEKKGHADFQAIAGYAFHPGNEFYQPPRHDDLTSEQVFEYTQNLLEHHRNFLESSPTKDSVSVFVQQDRLPVIVNFTVSFDEPGLYTYRYYYHVEDTYTGARSSSGVFSVVEKYSKAIGEDGRCKMSELTRVIKHDHSTLVCTTLATKAKLQTIGWAL